MTVSVPAGASAASNVDAGSSEGLVSAPNPHEFEQRLGLTWLRKLRWGAALGQVSILTVAWLVLRLELPVAPLLALVGFTALSNAALALVPLRLDRGFLLPTVLILDVLVLSALLAFSGGAANPFTVFFLVHVALAAVLLEPPLAWSMVLLTVGSFGALFLLPTDHTMHHDMMHHDMMHHASAAPWSAHLLGMWVAYAFAASFVTFFVGKVSRAIREQDAKLAAVAKQNERLATLSSFSATAAHELGSPLSTIGLAAKELRLGLLHTENGAALRADAELVCQEVARCRQILSGLSSRAGQTVGEMPVSTTASQVLDALRQMLSPRLAARVQFEFADETSISGRLVAPVHTLSQMLHNLVRNALEAHDGVGSSEQVEVTVRVADRVEFHVLDRGPGLSRELAERLGTPFVTTKSEEGGLGLGVYLVRSYAERMHGSLSFHERSGGGLDVELCFARDSLREAVP